MTWTPTMPQTPGRYFWRDREDHTYGICLIAWRRPVLHRGSVTPGELQVMSVDLWGYDLPSDKRWQAHAGENCDHPGWSQIFSTSGNRRGEGLEFWSEQVPVPPDFPAVSTERPPEPNPVDVEASRAKTKEDDQKRKKLEEELATMRKQDIQNAIDNGLTVYACQCCEQVLAPEDIVAVKTRSCPHCSTEFVEEDGERNCPDCNRPFTSLVEERKGCPECVGDCEEEPVLLVRDGIREG